MLYHLVKNSR